jgi:hypothetical protein
MTRERPGETVLPGRSESRRFSRSSHSSPAPFFSTSDKPVHRLRARIDSAVMATSGNATGSGVMTNA